MPVLMNMPMALTCATAACAETSAHPAPAALAAKSGESPVHAATKSGESPGPAAQVSRSPPHTGRCSPMPDTPVPDKGRRQSGFRSSWTVAGNGGGREGADTGVVGASLTSSLRDKPVTESEELATGVEDWTGGEEEEGCDGPA